VYQWVREGQALEIAGDDRARPTVGTKHGTPRTLNGEHVPRTRLFVCLFIYYSRK
jgi:hypothetical protein